MYQYLGGFQGNYRIYWVERVTSGSDTNYTIRYIGCNNISVCFLLPPEGQLPGPSPLLYAATPNWFIGKPLLLSNTLYWTEFDTQNLQNGDVKRRVYNAAGTGADTIATGQANLHSRVYVANNTLFFARRGNGVYTLPIDATAILRDFSVDGMEVTQGIQNLANNAPLIADKTTYVRAYGRQLSGPSTTNVEARLVGTRTVGQNEVPLPGSPLPAANGLRALTSGGAFDRARLNDGWYFLLPPAWIAAGATNCRVEIDPRQNHTDPDRDNNQISQTLTFQAQPPVCVMTVPVRTHNPRPSVYDPNVNTMFSNFERRWPVPDVWIFRDTSPVEELEVCWWGPVPYPCFGPYELTDGWGLGGIPDADKVIVSLWGRAQLSFNPDVCDDINAPVHFMGLVHPRCEHGQRAGLCQHRQQAILGKTARACAQSNAVGLGCDERGQHHGPGTGPQLWAQARRLQQPRRRRRQLPLSALSDRQHGRRELLRLRHCLAAAYPAQRGGGLYVLRRSPMGERLHLARTDE